MYTPWSSDPAILPVSVAHQSRDVHVFSIRRERREDRVLLVDVPEICLHALAATGQVIPQAQAAVERAREEVLAVSGEPGAAARRLVVHQRLETLPRRRVPDADQ